MHLEIEDLGQFTGMIWTTGKKHSINDARVLDIYCVRNIPLKAATLMLQLMTEKESKELWELWQCVQNNKSGR